MKLMDKVCFHKPITTSREFFQPNKGIKCVHYGDIYKNYSGKTVLSSAIINSFTNDIAPEKILYCDSIIVPDVTETVSDWGHFTYIKFDGTPYINGTHAVALTANSPLELQYIFRYLSSNPNRRRLQTLLNGSTVFQISIKNFSDFNLDKYQDQAAVQCHIVDILGSIDEKIEFFDSQIKLLEDQGQLLYKDIFESLTIKTEKIDLAKIAVFQNGYSYSGDELCEISADCLATIKNFDRQGGFKIDGFKPIKVAGKIKPEMYAEVGDLLVAHTDLTQNADIIGNPVLLLNTSTYKRVIISMDLVKVKSNTLSNELLYYILKSKKFKGHALGYCSGTTVLHLNKKALQEYTFDMPIDKEVIVRLEKQLSVIFDRIKLILKEIEQLKKLKELYLKKFFN